MQPKNSNPNTQPQSPTRNYTLKRLFNGAQIIAGIALATLAVSQAHTTIQPSQAFAHTPVSASQPVGALPIAAPAAQQPSSSEIASKASPAVFMIGVTDGCGGFTHIGTGFAITDDGSRGTVATNAHVADALIEAQQAGLRPVVRRPGVDRPEDFALLSAPEIHPGYAHWNDVASRGLLRRTAMGPESYQLIPPADVALLRTESGLGATLRLAEQEQIASMRPGDAVVYVGFPGEGMVGPQDNAPPKVGIGSVVALSGVALEVADPEDALIVHHTVLFPGGSSGGPLLMADPETGEPVVVAIHSAANHVHLENARVPVANAFAQRVDFLAELVNGDAHSNQILRNDDWAAAIHGSAMTVEERLEELRRLVDPDGRMRDVGARTIRLQGDANGAGDSVTITLRLEGGRTYAVIGTSTDWTDVDFEVIGARGRLAIDQAIDAYPAVRWTMPRSGEVIVRITAPRAFGPTDVEIRLLEDALRPPSMRRNG